MNHPTAQTEGLTYERYGEMYAQQAPPAARLPNRQEHQRRALMLIELERRGHRGLRRLIFTLIERYLCRVWKG